MPASLRILTWNLWHGLNPYERYLMSPMQTRAKHAERYRLQIEAIRAFLAVGGVAQTDVLCFQEVNPLASRFDELSAGIGRDGGACLVNAGVKLGGLGLPRGLQEGLAIFAGEAILEPAFDQLTLSGSAFEMQSPLGTPLLTLQGAERRKALLMEGRLAGRSVAVVCLHLHHGPDTGAENLARKTAELERLREWIEPRLESWDLVAICGDFNCESSSPCLTPLLGMGFEDSAKLAGVAQEPTWDPRQNGFAAESARLADTAETREWDGAPHVFDRIYLKARKPLRVTAHSLFKHAELSDHFGTWIEIGL